MDAAVAPHREPRAAAPGGADAVPGAAIAGHVDALTGVRALAAGWVFVYHLWLVSGKPALLVPALHIDVVPLVSMGWLGVDIFFILSGFVLTWQALHDAARAATPLPAASFWRDAARFMRRRVLRVHPAYLATLSVLLPLGWAGLADPALGLGDVAMHLVMFHNLVPQYVASINGVYWSMPFEFQFYLVFPLLVIPVLRGRSAWLVAAGVALATAMKLYTALHPPGAAFAQLPWRIDEFVVGMAAAAWAMRSRWSPRVHARIAACAALSLVLGAWLIARVDATWWQPGPLPFVRATWIDASVAMLLVGIARGHGSVARFFGWRPVVWIGLISYSIYLWHLPTLSLMRASMGSKLASAPLFAGTAATVAVLAVSALSYYAVEKPFHAPSPSASRAWRNPGLRLACVVAWALAVLAMAAWHYR